MTAFESRVADRIASASTGRYGQSFRDSLIVAWRNIRGGLRVPDTLVYMFIQPIMFVLLFAYVFGGAIPVEGVNYREYLTAGIFAQTMAFACAPASVGLADDMQKGLIDRFRSLPMARSGVIGGRVKVRGTGLGMAEHTQVLQA